MPLLGEKVHCLECDEGRLQPLCRLCTVERDIRYIKRRIHGLDLPDFSDESMKQSFKPSIPQKMYRKFLDGEFTGG